MKNKWVIAVVVFFVSCKAKTDVPGNVLPVNEMKVVMWNMIQADEYANSSIIKDSTKNQRQELLKLYSKVFYQNNISGEDFETSYQYYKSHPSIEKILLDSLQAYGNKMREANYQKVRLVSPDVSIATDTAAKIKY